jgi:membrane-associated phospholipid phosphatase
MGAVNVPEGAAFEGDGRHGGERALLIAALVCGALALAVAVLKYEPGILAACNVGPDSPALGFWSWIDRAAPAVLLTATVVLGVGVFLFARACAESRRAAVVLLGAFVVALTVTWALKWGLGRDRPLADPLQGTKLWSPLDLKDDRSFPSGHVCGATAICAGFWLAARRGLVRNVVWLVPPLMMFDRMCLAVHWPSDVLGGAAIGLASTAFVGRLARVDAVDRAASWFGRGGSARARFLLAVFAWLVVARFWRELPLGRDPVSGEVIAGFRTEPHWKRVAGEPLVGPSLHGALEDVRSLLWPTVAWYLVFVLAVQRNRRALALVIALPVFWLLWFILGWAPPDRFVATGRAGVFIDWHLHGGDPHDGRISAEHLGMRQEDRGVRWGMLTLHSKLVEDPSAVSGLDGSPWLGDAGTEWSGPLPGPGEPWMAPHALVFGPRSVLEAANAAPSILDAIRIASKGGALVVVAHYWRSQEYVPLCPSFEQLVDAGAHGFEVGNRRRETNPRALARLRALDRRCREAGLLRFSFSDDHGVPSGSPCVTFLEGVDPEALSPAAATAVFDRLRRGEGGIAAVPLLFHPGDPTLFPPRWIAPPVIAFEYFRSLRFPQQVSWLVYAGIAGLWMFRRRGAPAPEGPAAPFELYFPSR